MTPSIINPNIRVKGGKFHHSNTISSSSSNQLYHSFQAYMLLYFNLWEDPCFNVWIFYSSWVLVPPLLAAPLADHWGTISGALSVVTTAIKAATEIQQEDSGKVYWYWQNYIKLLELLFLCLFGNGKKMLLAFGNSNTHSKIHDEVSYDVASTLSFDLIQV